MADTPTLGAESPEAVVAAARAACATKDAGAALALLEPTTRTGMVARLAVLPDVFRVIKPMFIEMQKMMQGMMDGMAAMGEGLAGAIGDAFGAEAAPEVNPPPKIGGDDAAIEAELDGLIDAWEGVRTKHGLSLPSLEELGIDVMAGEPSPKELAGKLGSHLGDLDWAGFARDMDTASAPFVENQPEGSEMNMRGPVEEMAEWVPADTIADLNTSGDAATAQVGDRSVAFVQVEGRWYLQPANGDGE